MGAIPGRAGACPCDRNEVARVAGAAAGRRVALSLRGAALAMRGRP